MEAMEAEQKRAGKAAAPPATGDQYLLALIRFADWIPDTYKMLAEQNKQHAGIVRELYLCACDGFEAEQAAEILEAVGPKQSAQALQRKRKQYINAQADDKLNQEVETLKQTASGLQKEVSDLTQLLKHIAKQAPGLGTVFPEEPEEAGEPEEAELFAEDQPPALEERLDVARPGNVPESGTQASKEKWYAALKRKLHKLEPEETVSDFVDKLLKDGYSEEQMDYLLSCLEAGMKVADIKKFASPKFPVDIMRRLQRMNENKEGRK